MATPDDGLAADLSLQGAFSTTALAAGSGNVLRLQMSGATASGYRNNVYSAATGPDSPGSGNALVIIGNPTAFGQSNTSLLPIPGAQYFVAPE